MQKTKSRLLPVLLTLLILLFTVAGGVLGWMWYDSHIDRSGWELEDNVYFYRDFHNHRVEGWQNIDGSRYYFDPEDGMQTGWMDSPEGRRYLAGDGRMVTGWADVEGSRYCFGDDGLMQTGWLDRSGNRYYLGTDGVMATGWLELEDSTYYLDSDGVMVQGQATIHDEPYYFLEDGTMAAGWLDRDGSRFYYLPAMATGWQKIDGKLYYFDEKGAMAAPGWLELGEYSYYLQEDGSAAIGPLDIDGQRHYFTPRGIHVVLVNAKNPIPDYWDPEIVTLTDDWHQIALEAKEPMERMLADCEAAGFEYGINSTYRTGENQRDIVEQRTQEYMAQGMSYEQAYRETLKTAANPGTSEHEMGLAADLTGEEAKVWLGEHCWEYGFILRYPPEKQEITGIINEPWHFRYVGTEVSLAMKGSGLCLEEYLGAEAVGLPG